METEHAFDQSRPVVAFDFDGTITIQDSYTAFLRWSAGPAGYLAGLVRLAPDLILYPLDRDRGRLKAAATRTFLEGKRVEDVADDAERFADEVWSRFVRPDALAAWRGWGERDAVRVIVTASPTLTVRPFAERLGADLLLGTELEIANRRLTGAFATPNCRGREKVARLRAAFGPAIRLAAAYGDTSGDTEMLLIADHKGWREFNETP